MKTAKQISDVTVIIATAGERPELLQRAIDSAVNQTAGEPRVLVGTDKFRVGPAKIRNLLSEQVETDWMLFLDDDDYLYPDYFETVLPELDGNDVVYTWFDRNFDWDFDFDFQAHLLRQGNFIPVTSCVRTSMFREVLGFPTGKDIIYEDWGLWVEILDEGGKFKCIQKKKWFYEKQEQNRTDTNNEIWAAKEKDRLSKG